ncbi:hypothetical protein ABE52_23435, partial [Bacillus thuringiensis]|nr:hypothetical protein [Bacillus thuringiensis]
MKLQLKADLGLLLVTFFWGASILLTKLGLDGIEEYNLIALRFIIAFLLSGLIFYKHLFKNLFKIFLIKSLHLPISNSVCYFQVFVH